MLPHCQRPTGQGQCASPLHPQAYSQCQHLSQILAEQCRRWDLPTDNQWVTGNTVCCWPCSRGVRGVGQQGRQNRKGGTSSSAQCSLPQLQPQVSSRIPQSPPWPVQGPALPRIFCSLTPKPGHQKPQSTGAVKSRVPVGTVPCDRGVPAPLGHCKEDLGSCCSHLGWICLR